MDSLPGLFKYEEGTKSSNNDFCATGTNFCVLVFKKIW